MRKLFVTALISLIPFISFSQNDTKNNLNLKTNIIFDTGIVHRASTAIQFNVDHAIENAKYNWDFGDHDLTSRRMNPQHEFKFPGTYTITLLVSKGEKDHYKTESTILIGPAPDAEIVYEGESKYNFDDDQWEDDVSRDSVIELFINKLSNQRLERPDGYYYDDTATWDAYHAQRDSFRFAQYLRTKTKEFKDSLATCFLDTINARRTEVSAVEYVLDDYLNQLANDAAEQHLNDTSSSWYYIGKPIKDLIYPVLMNKDDIFRVWFGAKPYSDHLYRRYSGLEGMEKNFQLDAAFIGVGYAIDIDEGIACFVLLMLPY